MAPPVFKTGLAGIAFAGGFDSLPPPPRKTLRMFLPLLLHLSNSTEAALTRPSHPKHPECRDGRDAGIQRRCDGQG